MTLVDTNVLIDLLTDDPNWASWSSAALTEAVASEGAFFAPIAYAEAAGRFDNVQQLNHVLAALSVQLIEPPRTALFLAGKAFQRYRRSGGPRTVILADFLIGAHAAVLGMRVLTRDPKRYRTYFPEVQLITP